MSAFHYQVLTATGKTQQGILEADSERHARQQLRDRGLTPLVIQLTTQHSKRFSTRLSAADLSLITRQLATLLSAGIPVEEAILSVSEQTDKKSVQGLLMAVRSKVLEGYSLAQALDEFPKAFKELYRATVGAGEQTGRLDLVLEKLADYTEHRQAARQKIQQALIYPSLMVFVSISIISFLLVFVVPKIVEVFINSGQSLPDMTRALIFISHFLSQHGLMLLGLFVTGFIVFRLSLRNLAFKLAWHRLLLKLPITAYLIKSTNMARYIHTFGILFQAGVSVLDTMRVSASVVNNLVIRDAVLAALSRVREGEGISHALKATGFLSPMAVHLIASGEKTGSLSDMMTRCADYLDQEVRRLLDTALTLLEPVVIILMGAVVLFIVLAMLLPIFSMEQLVH